MLQTKRLAWHIKPGNIRNLRLEEELLDHPGPGEVQIEVIALGLNFADIFTLLKLYKAAPKTDFIPGLEYAGIVRKTGAGVDHFHGGDRVMGVTRFGGWATIINADARYIVPLPSEWTFGQGAAFLVQSITAWYALVELGRLEAEETVLIHSGAGGVGLQANRIAKKLGAYTIGTVGSQVKLETLDREGYDHGILRTRQFPQELARALSGRPLNLILECIGGKILKEGFKQLAPEGRMVLYGSASFSTPGDRVNYPKLLLKYLMRPRIDPLMLPGENKSLMGFNLIWLYNQVEKMHLILQRLADLELEPPLVGHEFSFRDIPKAIRILQSGKTVGKVVVKVGDSQ